MAHLARDRFQRPALARCQENSGIIGNFGKKIPRQIFLNQITSVLYIVTLCANLYIINLTHILWCWWCTGLHSKWQCGEKRWLVTGKNFLEFFSKHFWSVSIGGKLICTISLLTPPPRPRPRPRPCWGSGARAKAIYNSEQQQSVCFLGDISAGVYRFCPKTWPNFSIRLLGNETVNLSENWCV